MPKTCGEPSWFEKITREFENDTEYLKEYISLCSSEIGCLQKKVADLEQRMQGLEYLYNKAVSDIIAEHAKCKQLEAENALLRKQLEPIEAAYTEYKGYPLSAIVKRDAYNQAINRCMENGEGK